jgi:hypothetical protein
LYFLTESFWSNWKVISLFGKELTGPGPLLHCSLVPKSGRGPPVRQGVHAHPVTAHVALARTGHRARVAAPPRHRHCRSSTPAHRLATPTCAASAQPFPLRQSSARRRYFSLHRHRQPPPHTALLRAIRRCSLSSHPDTRRCVGLLLELSFAVKIALCAAPPSTIARPLHAAVRAFLSSTS